MQAQAELKKLRVSPRKARLVGTLVKGMDVLEAEKQLRFINKKAAPHFRMLLKSAVANATNNFGLSEENLFIKEVLVNKDLVLKRWMPRAFGRAYPILKRTSRVKLVLDEKVPGKDRRKMASKIPEKTSTEKGEKGQGKEVLKKVGSKEKGVPQKGLANKFKNIKSRFFQRKSG